MTQASEAVVEEDAPKLRSYEIETPGEKTFVVRSLNPQWPVFISKKSKPGRIPLTDESGIDYVSACIHERIDAGLDCPILVSGRRGFGKSTFIRKLTKRTDHTFGLPQVAFRLEQFEKLCETNPQGCKGTYPQIWMDEAGFGLFGQDWMERVQRTIVKQLIISRIKRQIMYFAVPKASQLNSQIRDMPFIWIHIKKEKDYGPSYAIVRIAPAKLESEWADEEFWVPQCAVVFKPEQDAWWSEYEKAKYDFVTEASKDLTTNKLTQFKYQIAKKLQDMEWTHEKIGNLFGVSRVAITQLVNNFDPIP